MPAKRELEKVINKIYPEGGNRIIECG